MTSSLRALVSWFITRRWLCWLGVVIWGAVLFSLSSQSTLPPGPKIPHQDKVVHFLYFSSGAFCFTLALYARQTPLSAGWLWTVTGMAFGLIIGALDEYHQTFTPGRSGNDPGDLLADLTGAGMGGWAAWMILAWIRRKHGPKAA
ncbi:VanZ family protein [Prosthecobacter sp. SYSU 5D2]|uniref:VanZ family protein n=1 Tax=Prosthecobacter sp. SYSU 5D2 TaxID=3134134 RepID=UPI0031FEC52C